MARLHEVKQSIQNGEMNEMFHQVYVDHTMLEAQKKRYIKALETFEQVFPNVEEINVYSAPGRSEIGGNHTDHQHGKVLAAAVNLDTIAIVSKTTDLIVTIVSEGFEIKPVDISNLDVVKEEIGSSESLIRGVCARIHELGYEIGGFQAFLTSNVLEGAGLSSSAAFEVLIGTIVSHAFNNGVIDAIEIAKIGQYSENVYFDKPCGLMDQMASSVGSFVSIDFELEGKPKVEKVAFDFDTTNHSLCIVDTKGSHSDLTDDYAAIPYEMANVSNHFNKNYLREVDEKEFYKNIKQLREAYGDRSVLRAMHYFEENKRVVEQVSALNKHDFEAFKVLIQESGNSSFKYLQNVYATKSYKEQNISIALAMSEKILKHKGVCRVHGGGFAGTIQAFVPNELLDTYKQQMENVFGENTCYVLKIRPYGGVRVI